MSIGKIFSFGSKTGLKFDSQKYSSVSFNGSLCDIYAKYGIPKPVQSPVTTDSSKDAPAVKYGIPKPPKKDEFITNNSVPQKQETASNHVGIKYAIPNKNFA